MNLSQACSILGVEPTTPIAEARTRYRTRAQMIHPDRVEPMLRSEAERAMSELTEAWAVFQRDRASWTRSPSSGTENDRPLRPPAQGECYLCGRYPAAMLQLHKGQGLVIFRRRADFAGPVCRDCGLSVFREYQASTLTAGWWGIIAFFANIAYVVGNWAAIRQHRLRVPKPQGRDSTVVSPLPPGLPLSKPILRRVGPILGSGLAVATVALLAGLAITSGDPSSTESPPPTTSPVGQCLTEAGFVADCDGSTAAYKIVLQVTDVRSCHPPNVAFTSEHGDVFCAERLP